MTVQATTRASGHQPGWGVLDLRRLGPVALAWNACGLVRIAQGARMLDPAELAHWLPELGPLPSPTAVPARFADALRAFERGEPIDPAHLPVDLRGTPFQNKVWRALRAVPRGRVCTYGGLAAGVGAPRAMRAVGTALAKNPLPIVVPCHRVVAHGLRLGGYSGGLDRKRALLALEGVRIDGDRVLPGQLDRL